MAHVPLQDACNLDGGKGFQRKARNKTPGFVRLTFFLYPAASPDVERVNPSAYVSRCVASAHAACPSCVLTPQLHRTVTLRHKKACKARSVNASCLRPRSLVPVQPTGISSHRDRAAERPTLFIPAYCTRESWNCSHNITHPWYYYNLGTKIRAATINLCVILHSKTVVSALNQPRSVGEAHIFLSILHTVVFWPEDCQNLYIFKEVDVT